MKKLFLKLWRGIKSSVSSDELRRKTLFRVLNVALALTAFAMTIVNIFTKEYQIMWASTACMIFVVANIFLVGIDKIRNVVYTVFVIAVTILLGYFLISGIPNGFSALWIVLVPGFAMLVFGLGGGSAFSLTIFALTAFMLWTPLGQSLLQFEYTKEFMLRFPFLYLSIYAISLFIEIVRRETQKQLEQAKKQFYYLYRHDALTGLYNRYGMLEFVEHVYDEKSQTGVTAMLFDVDNFKTINDAYGHEFGDQVLVKIAQITKNIVCEECQCCRWGGEEFLLLMQCNYDPKILAERLLAEIAHAPVMTNDKEVHVTISIGECVAKNLKEDEFRKIIDLADRAMYRAKQAGKNRIEFCEYDSQNPDEE